MSDRPTRTPQQPSATAPHYVANPGIDDDGDCIVCGLPVERVDDTEAPHSCPPGFGTERILTLADARRAQQVYDGIRNGNLGLDALLQAFAAMKHAGRHRSPRERART